MLTIIPLHWKCQISIICFIFSVPSFNKDDNKKVNRMIRSMHQHNPVHKIYACDILHAIFLKYWNGNKLQFSCVSYLYCNTTTYCMVSVILYILKHLFILLIKTSLMNMWTKLNFLRNYHVKCVCICMLLKWMRTCILSYYCRLFVENADCMYFKVHWYLILSMY